MPSFTSFTFRLEEELWDSSQIEILIFFIRAFKNIPHTILSLFISMKKSIELEGKFLHHWKPKKKEKLIDFNFPNELKIVVEVFVDVVLLLRRQWFCVCMCGEKKGPIESSIFSCSLKSDCKIFFIEGRQSKSDLFWNFSIFWPLTSDFKNIFPMELLKWQ